MDRVKPPTTRLFCSYSFSHLAQQQHYRLYSVQNRTRWYCLFIINQMNRLTVAQCDNNIITPT